MTGIPTIEIYITASEAVELRSAMRACPCFYEPQNEDPNVVAEVSTAFGLIVFRVGHRPGRTWEENALEEQFHTYIMSILGPSLRHVVDGGTLTIRVDGGNRSFSHKRT